MYARKSQLKNAKILVAQSMRRNKSTQEYFDDNQIETGNHSNIRGQKKQRKKTKFNELSEDFKLKTNF